MMALKLKATEMISQFHPLHSPIARLLPWRKLRLLQMVDYKSTSGTAWSHSFLNQKPWHPLSYPNQRKKWIAEQQHTQHQRRNEEASREYAQEQFFRQAALVSKKEKEKAITTWYTWKHIRGEFTAISELEPAATTFNTIRN